MFNKDASGKKGARIMQKHVNTILYYLGKKTEIKHYVSTYLYKKKHRKLLWTELCLQNLCFIPNPQYLRV